MPFFFVSLTLPCRSVCLDFFMAKEGIFHEQNSEKRKSGRYMVIQL